jgi:SPW repeat
MKILKPLPHGVIDYAWAGTMMAAPWLFGFSKNRRARLNAVGSGAAILGLSLMTRYPLGAAKVVSFQTHGVIETVAGMMTAAAPWTLAFSGNRSARWTHVLSGLGTLAVVAMTDYRAAEDGQGDGQASAVASLDRGDGRLLAEGSQEGPDLHAAQARESQRETV